MGGCGKCRNKVYGVSCCKDLVFLQGVAVGAEKKGRKRLELYLVLVSVAAAAEAWPAGDDLASLMWADVESVGGGEC